MEYFNEDIIFTKLVDIIDRIKELPKECPEILNSPTFQSITKDIDSLCEFLHAQAEALNNNAIFPSPVKGGMLN